MKKSRHPLLKNTLLLTAAGLISRIIGFFYKIFLASLIGAEGIGLYQMVFPTYLLCVSLASSGIQTAISRFTAEKISTGHQREAKLLFLSGLSLAESISVVLSALLFLLAKPLSFYLWNDSRCLPLLRLMALAIPFETLHSCANGYFLGQKKALFPALSQLLEQGIRTGATLFLCRILLQEHRTLSPTLPAAALLLAEISAAFMTFTVLAFQKSHASLPPAPQTAFSKNLSQILSMALPLTANRLLLNLLQSVEAILLPLLLQYYYGDRSSALSIYGIFSGMALPLILFPCTITGSFSMILLPSVSEAHALKNDKKIAAAIHSSLLLCLFLGITCTFAFLLFGPSMGLLLYQTETVGSYLCVLAWICPFLYLSATNSSILHGLGKTMTVFRHNLIGLLIRLLFFLAFIPPFGISGCLWGFLLSHLLTAFLDLTALRRCIISSIPLGTLILLPCGCCTAATGLLKLLQFLFPLLSRTDQWIPFLLSAGIWGCSILILYGTIPRSLFRSQDLSA